MTERYYKAYNGMISTWDEVIGSWSFQLLAGTLGVGIVIGFVAGRLLR